MISPEECKTCNERDEKPDGSLACAGTIYCPRYGEEPPINYLILDTETTGFPPRGVSPQENPQAWPHIVEIGWLLLSENRTQLEKYSAIIKPEGFTIPELSTKIHGITTKKALEEGIILKDALSDLERVLQKHTPIIIGHNVTFDLNVILAEQTRTGQIFPLGDNIICTMREGTDFCAIPSPYGGNKYPKLSELHQKLFGDITDQDHRVMGDIKLTKECFFEMKARGIITCP